MPTDLGYRCYVDQLLAERRAARLAPDVEERLRRAGTVEDVLSHASQELSRASQQVGFAMVPATEASFEHVDFVALDAGRVLVVLVSSGGHIAHKVIEPPERYDADELRHAANFLNTEFRGRSLNDVRQLVVDRLLEERTLYDALMARALQLASRTFDGLEPQATIYIQGTALLFETTGGDDPETTLATLRLAAADDRREVAARPIHRRVHGQRADGDHRLRALGSRTAVLQHRDLHVYRRAAPRRGGRHRT